MWNPTPNVYEPKWEISVWQRLWLGLSTIESESSIDNEAYLEGIIVIELLVV